MKKYWLLFVVLLLLVINIFLLRLDLHGSSSILTFAMLDVGQGDALFIESPNGTQVMFDLGPAHKALGPLSGVISPFDRDIDALIITNPDSDHIGSFSDIFKKYKIGMVLESGALTDSKIYQNLKTEIIKQKIPNFLAKRGMRLDIGGGAFIDILFPDRDVREWATNEGSVVARVVYGNTSIMLTGDATAKTEKIILSENLDTQLNSTFLKIGHHGSRTSTTSSFFDAVSPFYALISVGKDNTYGHPHKETLDTITQKGAQILRTDLLGTIIIKCDIIGECKIN